MTEEETYRRLASSLTDAIDEWWEEDGAEVAGDYGPWIANGTIELMAQSAVNILRSAKMNEDHMKNEGMLADKAG